MSNKNDAGNPLSEPPQEVPSQLGSRRNRNAPITKRQRRNFAAEAEDARADLAALRQKVATALRLLRRAKDASPPDPGIVLPLVGICIEELESGTEEK